MMLSGTNKFSCSISSSFYSRTSNLPTRGTRLLNRSRVQSGLTNCPDSPRSVESIPRPRRSSSLTKTPSPMQATMTANKATMVSPPNPEDLTISRSARNTMIQDVLYFKKQLLRLRHLLQEVRKIKGFLCFQFILFILTLSVSLFMFIRLLLVAINSD